MKKEGEKEGKDGEAEAEEAKEDEPLFEMLPNPARVTLDQEAYIVWEDGRYRPITPVRSPSGSLARVRRANGPKPFFLLPQGRPSGVLIVTDTTPSEAEEFVKTVAPSMNSSMGELPLLPSPRSPFLTHTGMLAPDSRHASQNT